MIGIIFNKALLAECGLAFSVLGASLWNDLHTQLCQHLCSPSNGSETTNSCSKL